MPCMSYDNSWDRGDDDRRKIRELKKQADMLARIACKALTELEKNEVEDLLLLQDDEVRTWWMKHKEDDARERARVAELERKARIKAEALARLSDEEKELLGLAQPKKSVAKTSSSANKSSGVGSNPKVVVIDIEKMLEDNMIEYERWEDPDDEEI
jgi:succinate dehydrogenase flavin-adding protein (antitoxin of CptAB toxin-antitoxin module)